MNRRKATSSKKAASKAALPVVASIQPVEKAARQPVVKAVRSNKSSRKQGKKAASKKANKSSKKAASKKANKSSKKEVSKKANKSK